MGACGDVTGHLINSYGLKQARELSYHRPPAQGRLRIRKRMEGSKIIKQFPAAE